MIFQTQNQLNCFLIFIFCGIIIGLISQIYFLFFLINFQKKPTKIIFFTFFYSFFYIFYVFLLNIFNFGKFSLSLFFAYVIGFLWIKFILSKLVVILEKKWYNTIITKFKSRIKKGKIKNK